MKIAGCILLVFGVLGFWASIKAGHNPMISLFFGVLGLYLISRDNKNKREQEDKDKWCK